MKKLKKIGIFGLIGLIAIFFIGFGGFSCSPSTSSEEGPFGQDWSKLDNPSEHAPYPAFHRVKIPSELEGKIEAYYSWNQEIEGEGTDYEMKELWCEIEVRNISEWPIIGIAGQYTYKDETTGEIFLSSIRVPQHGFIEPRDWIWPGEKGLGAQISLGGENFSPWKIAYDPSSGISEEYDHQWSIQESFIRAVRFYQSGKYLSEEEFKKEFWATVSQLDTPEKVVDYLNKNFVFEDRESDEPYSPWELFEKKRGGAQDFAVFIDYFLKEVNSRCIVKMKGDKAYDYEGKERQQFNSGIWLFKYIKKDTGEKGINITVDACESKAWGRYFDIIFTENGPEILYNITSLAGIIEKEEERLKAEITELAGASWNWPNLRIVEWEDAAKYKGEVPDYYQPPS